MQKTILAWLFGKFNNHKNTVRKSLHPNAECVITLNCINKNQEYYQCDKCVQVYLKNPLEEWFKKNSNRICPYCQTNSINTDIIYLNY